MRRLPAAAPFATTLWLFTTAVAAFVWTEQARSTASVNKTEVQLFHGGGALQGATVGEHAFYAVSSRTISRHDKETGKLTAVWSATSGSIVHLNSCIVRRDRLVCAHSNYPERPAKSAIESFDSTTLVPVGRRDLGMTPGWLTWADWHNDSWWLCFANYAGASPGVVRRPTVVVQYDEDWRRRAVWLFPASVRRAFGSMSASGGAWGSDGYLYVTGHDRPELYVLRLPRSGAVLEHVATLPIPIQGQAFGWDPTRPRMLYGIDRKARAVVTTRVPAIPAR